MSIARSKDRQLNPADLQQCQVLEHVLTMGEQSLKIPCRGVSGRPLSPDHVPEG